MNTNEFLTIQEFIQKYEVPDIRIRRRIRKYRLVDPKKLEGILTKRYEKGVGNVILLKEDFWVKELEAVAKKTAYAVPPKRLEVTEQNSLSSEQTAYAVPISRSDVGPDQIVIDREFLELLKEDRIEKKDWIKKYDSLLIDYKAKDKELVEREKFLQGLVEKVIADARTTKKMLASQINHLQKQLHTPKKEEGIEFDNGNFTESEDKGTE